MYKIDNKNQKAKIKNLEQRLDFQKYNIKKKEEEEGKKKLKEKKTKKRNKQTNKATRIIKKQQPLHKDYIRRFFLKKIRSFFF